MIHSPFFVIIPFIPFTIFVTIRFCLRTQWLLQTACSANWKSPSSKLICYSARTSLVNRRFRLSIGGDPWGLHLCESHMKSWIWRLIWGPTWRFEWRFVWKIVWRPIWTLIWRPTRRQIWVFIFLDVIRIVGIFLKSSQNLLKIFLRSPGDLPKILRRSPKSCQHSDCRTVAIRRHFSAKNSHFYCALTSKVWGSKGAVSSSNLKQLFGILFVCFIILFRYQNFRFKRLLSDRSKKTQRDSKRLKGVPLGDERSPKGFRRTFKGGSKETQRTMQQIFGLKAFSMFLEISSCNSLQFRQLNAIQCNSMQLIDCSDQEH